jgi:hypothetical protein
MAKPKHKPYPQAIVNLMGEKTTILTKAQALAAMGMGSLAVPLWAAAASYEERIAPLLEAVGRAQEAAVHRISAASCYQKAHEFGRAANLYMAALAGPLNEQTRQEVKEMLAACLTELAETTVGTPA